MEGNVHKDTAAECVLGLLDDAVDDHLFDVEDGEHGRGKDKHDGLGELRTGACAREGYMSVDVASGRITRLTGVRSQTRRQTDQARRACRAAQSGGRG